MPLALRKFIPGFRLIDGSDLNKVLNGTNPPLSSVADGLTAHAGGGQASALVLTSVTNLVTTVASANDSVALPLAVLGLRVTVVNEGANSLQVYGSGTDTINIGAGDVATGTGVPLASGKSATYLCTLAAPAGEWTLDGTAASGGGSSGSFTTVTTTGNVTVGGLLYESAATGITAGTTRTQAGATALTKEVNRVDTSTAPASGSTLGDGVLLPASVAGLDITVINNTANPIQVYGAGADTINGQTNTVGVPIPPNCVEMFECPVAGVWYYDAGVGFSGPLNTVLAVDNVSAAGSTQAAATQLVADFNKITTATANQGVKLPASAPGLDIFIENHTGQPITVYGAGTDTIDDVATATGVSQMDSSVVLFTCYAAGKWYSNGLATGYAKNPQSGTVLETMQFADAISAAGTTQGTATQLSAAINTVATVGAGAGVNLPASAPGLVVIVINTGANALLVYPAQGASDTINGVAASVGVSLFPGAAAQFNCTATGAWTTQPGTTKNAGFNTASNTTSFTATAAQVTGGASTVDLALTGTLGSGQNITLPSATSVILALHSPTVGTSYRLRIINQSSGNFAWTVLQGTGNTLVGATATIAQNASREYVVTVTNIGTPAITYQNVANATWN